MTTMAEHDEQVQRWRIEHAQALKREIEAAVATRSAGGELFAALRARQAVRWAAAGNVVRYTADDPDSGVPFPCACCYREISPFGDTRHEIIQSGGELPYARCDLGTAGRLTP